MSAAAEWCGVVDCLGYLICRGCSLAGRGKRLEAYVFGPPHSEEPCDCCGASLKGETWPAGVDPREVL